ncbi:MAG TPA: flagellar regulator YcgR PilZN domain-containing protein [Methylobacter sp.]|jgi:hypothetical protein
MLAYQLNHAAPQHKRTPESATMGSLCNNYTLASQEEIRKKLNLLLSKNVILTIKVPGKFATSTLLTTITCIEDGHIFLGGFQNERFNKDLLTQNTLVVSASFEGIAVSFILGNTVGMNIDAAFNLKAHLPQSMEWVQRRDARRVKVPINIPVQIQFKNQAECYNVADVSVDGLSYIIQSGDHSFASIGGLHTDCNIIMPDKSAHLACLEIVNSITIPYKHTKQINRVGCEIKRASYRLDTALQRLINQIDFYYQ